jgi:hypothetical protein
MSTARARRNGRRPRPPGRLATVLLAGSLLGACLLQGCGAAQVSPDLFLVERSTNGTTSKLTLVVSEEGGLRCDGGRSLMLSDPQIIEARTIAEELQNPISHHLDLPAGPHSVYAYRLRNGEGSIAFADTSQGPPKEMHVLHKLELFVAQVAEGVCHLH